MDTTDIIHSGRIFALSDIHGDLHSFIIILRDCAKVITKKNIDQGIVDPDIENNLNIDISESDNNYDDSLGYTWCGDNSIVVICGDIIDPSRSNGCKNINGLNCSEYPQIEIKIIRFINSINKSASLVNGSIIKLLGNHELASILGNQYDNIYDSDLFTLNYYRGDKRNDVFKVGHSGFKLLFQDKCYILLKINNSIFVHGQLPKYNISKIKEINQFINNLENHNIINQIEWNNKFKLILMEKTSLLLNREWAKPDNINDRHIESLQEKLCNNVRKDLINFMGHTDIDNLRVILGHCPQNSSSTKNLINTTMTFKMEQDNCSKTYSSKKYYTGQITNSDQDTIFGITMQCPKPKIGDYTDFYIYQVDISSSRGFDSLNYYEKISSSDSESISNENKYLFSKTPQILSIQQIDCIDFVTIIKSKMKNTRIHLPRPNYEKMIKIKNMTSLKLDSGNYDQKYKKYKNKYIRLKKIIN